MAVIENRGPLQWRALIRRKGFPSFSRTFERQRDAQGWATDVEAAIGRRDLAELRRLTNIGEADLSTVADLVDKFLTDIVTQPGRRAGQVASEKPRLARIRAALGKLTLEMLSQQDVAGWRDKRLKEAEPQTVRHDMNQLSVVLNTAISEWGVQTVNVVRDVKKPTLPTGRDRRTSQAEIDLLLAEADYIPPEGGRPTNRGMKPIILLAVETSMRLGELLGLEWRHIDLERQTAHLPKTKNGESRTVALSSTAVEALKTMQSEPRADGRVFDWARADSFTGRFSGLVSRARTKYEAKCKASGKTPNARFLVDIRFHDLRHEATSRLFEKGLNVMEVASMTGHKSMQMLKRYTHVEAEKVAAKLG
ncbi:tyrosine-type recombinase/integrase [Paucibacter sp. JuS9]|uniref:tyrosine-type recombinase/integrase n=1 Tax=Paucibacter sp. JuS9 TaxID=3228748 RepID=UPI003756EAC0